MKRVIAVLMLVVFAVGLVLISDDAAFAWGKDKDKDKDKDKAETKEGAAREKLVCAFKNDEQMAEFEQLYVSKQATFGRMGVLQAYFSMEQSSLTAIDRQMEEKFGFKMDPSKIYDLNRDKREIREVGPITPPATTE